MGESASTCASGTTRETPNKRGGEPGTLQIVLAEQARSGYLLVDVDLASLTLGHAEMLDVTQYNESIFDFVLERAKNGDMNNEHTLRVTDPEGNVLALIPLSSAVAGHSETGNTIDTVELIPWFDTAASLDLLHNDEVVDSRRPTTPPIVEIEPLTDPESREFSFSWIGSDPEGDPVVYTPMWSVGRRNHLEGVGHPDVRDHRIR